MCINILQNITGHIAIARWPPLLTLIPTNNCSETYENIKAVAPKLGGDSRTNHVSISGRTNGRTDKGKLICPRLFVAGHKNRPIKAKIKSFPMLHAVA